MNQDIINQAVEEIRKSHKAQHAGKRIGFGNKPCLVVIDFQKCLTDTTRPTGTDLDYEIQNTKLLIEKAREKNIPIIYTVTGYDEDCFDGGLWTVKMPVCSKWKLGTDDCELDDRLGYLPGEKIIIKKYCSMYLGTGLASFLTAKGIDTVIVTGFSTSGCVRASVTDTLCNGFRPIVVRECVGDRDKLSHEVNLMEIDTRFGDVMSLEDVTTHLDTI